MNILIVHPHIFAGGAEKVLLNLAYQLEKHKCKVDIATLTSDLSKLPPHLHNLNFILPGEEICIPIMRDLKSTVESVGKETKLLIEQIRERMDRYDLLNPHNFPAYWATALAGCRKPIVWHCNEVLGPYGQTRDLYENSPVFRLTLDWVKKLDSLLVRRSVKKIITCSDLNRRLVEERYGIKPEVANTCVDYAFFSRKIKNAKSKLGIEGSPLLLHVGSLIQRKNQLASIQALKILKDKIDSAKLALVGEGPWKPILQKAVKQLKLESDVYFFGEVTEEKLRCLYYACDINLYPVRDQSWGLVPFEALAAQKPSITSPYCGAAETLSSRKLGIVVKPEPKRLAEAAYYLLKNPQIMEDIAKRGQNFLINNLTCEVYAEKILKIFQNSI